MSEWKVLSSEDLLKSPFFRLRKDRCELPDGRIMPGYYVIDFADWVHVLPITAKREVVLVRQYRYGAQASFLELPGGTCDPRSPEDPEQAALRELLEETGFSPGRCQKVGESYPNPALQSNRLHTYLAWDCQKIQEPQLDPYEDLVTELMPLDELMALAERGKIQHGLMLSSLMMARPFL